MSGVEGGEEKCVSEGVGRKESDGVCRRKEAKLLGRGRKCKKGGKGGIISLSTIVILLWVYNQYTFCTDQ